jgi:hypothetical protein
VLEVVPADVAAWGAIDWHQHVARAVAASSRPVLLALPPDLPEAEMALILDPALAAGVQGLILAGGIAAQSPGDEHGRLSGRPACAATLASVRTARRRWGRALTIIASDGIVAPGDALALLDADADLVQLSAGFVVAGPGLPKRINEALIWRTGESVAPSGTGWHWLALLGWGMIVGGTLAWIVGATRVVLPYDETFVGIDRAGLAALNPRLLPFMQHDRVTLAGTMLSIGILYFGLSWGGIRRGAHWARRALVLSAVAGFSSFFLFLGFGYFDPLHALVTLLLFPFFLLGLRGHADRPPQVPEPDLINDRAWRRAAWGQLLLVGLGIGLLVAGATIALIGCTSVFVPEDLAYLQTTPEALRAINPRLIALVAHDRAGFGGALASTGLAILATGLWGIRRGARWVWWTVALAGSAGFWGAIGTHLEVSYLNLLHLAPALIALVVFAASLVLLWSYLCGPSPLHQSQTR